MSPIVTTGTVGPDGTLTLTLPPEAAGRNVRVTVEHYGLKKLMTQAEWEEFVLSTAGGWQGEFERPPQDVEEERDPL